MSESLLIEIGTEELPAVPFLKELPNIGPKWERVLKKNGLNSEYELYFTPRRIVLIHQKFPSKQPDTKEEFFGAPIEIAYDDSGPTKAALGFARKCGVDVEKLSTSFKNGKEVLYYSKVVKGRESKEILGDMINEWLRSLDFGRSMRWGDSKEEFIRPIRWALVLMNETFLEFEIFGVKSSNFTYVHRSVTTDKVELNGWDDYFKKLESKKVILSQYDRAARIERFFENICESHKVTIDKDKELFEEVVAITEYPTPLLGTFDEKFLQLPPEVIITSMKEHQRYFPVFEKSGLKNSFVVVSNAVCEDYTQVIRGNERVLKARLSDALFFWENDLKRGLDPEGLKNLLFMDELGSMFDKELRELKIAMELLKSYEERLTIETGLAIGEIRALIERAVMLSKADLLTEMVYEFTELQGVMGYYYALKQGEDPLVAEAIKEQYLPSGEDSRLPGNLFSSIVALSYRLDTLMALFSIGKIPTGSKDPFALRRAAIGVIKIVLEFSLPFDIKRDLASLAKEYEKLDPKKLEEFFLERFYQFFDANPSLISAVIKSGERDIVKFERKLKALKEIVQTSGFKENFTTFKRVANIVKDHDLSDLRVDESLFESEFETDLWKEFKRIDTSKTESVKERLENLFSLKESIDRFFDNVLVNAPQENIRRNRKNMIASIYMAFKEIADIKEISL